jgi:hypothetical protein
MLMSKMMLQRILLIAGVIALVIVLIDGGYSIAATIPGKTPARVDHVTAGPYHLVVSMYTYPANAGFALPFAITPEQAVKGPLTFHINSLPGPHVDANPVRATFSANANVPSQQPRALKGRRLVPRPKPETKGWLTTAHSRQVYHPEQEKSDTSPECCTRH